MQEFEWVIEGISAENLPTVNLPPTAELTAHGHLYQLLNSWMSAGAHEPFSWEALEAQTAGVAALARSQLGPLWEKWAAAAPWALYRGTSPFFSSGPSKA